MLVVPLQPASFDLAACYSRIPSYVTTIEGALPVDDRTDLVRMGLAEALANAILHGALGVSSEARRAGDVARFLDEVIAAEAARGATLLIEVRVDRTAEHTEIVIADPGPGFDWRRASRTHGRGLWILEHAFARVAWNPMGNRITLAVVRAADPRREASLRAKDLS